MIINSSFKPTVWLANNHLQTILPVINHLKHPLPVKTDYITLPDGDVIELAWSQENSLSDAPLVILLHGLAGNTNSHYIKRTMYHIAQAGYRSVLIHFRGTGTFANKQVISNQVNVSQDLDYLIGLMNQNEPETAKAIIGFSMGGNHLLKWLGETRLKKPIQTAIAVSVPFDLANCTDTLNASLKRGYQSYLLNSLKKLTLRKINLINKHLPINDLTLGSIRSIRAYDEMITAPLNGFADADAYYQHMSCQNYLSGIQNETLIIHAKDDPFMSTDIIPGNQQLSPSTTLELSDHGGHLGFVEACRQFKLSYWLPKRIVTYLNTQHTSK